MLTGHICLSLISDSVWFTCNFFAYFRFHSDLGRVIGKIKQNELDSRDTAPLTQVWLYIDSPGAKLFQTSLPVFLPFGKYDTTKNRRIKQEIKIFFQGPFLFFKVSPFDNYLNQKHTLQANFLTKGLSIALNTAPWNDVTILDKNMCHAQGYKSFTCTYLRPLVTVLVEWRANYLNMLLFSDMIKKNRKLKFVLGPSTTFWYIQNFIRLEIGTSLRVSIEI